MAFALRAMLAVDNGRCYHCNYRFVLSKTPGRLTPGNCTRDCRGFDPRSRPWSMRTHDEVDPAEADAGDVQQDGQNAHEDAKHAYGGAREVDDLGAARAGVDIRPALFTALSMHDSSIFLASSCLKLPRSVP